MNSYFADLHIHIGRTGSGRAVKITGAKTLTLQNILEISSRRKGLDMIGIIDCHSPEVLEELENLISEGKLTEHPRGGLQFGKTVLIPGSEIEINDQYCHGPIHILAFFPTIDAMRAFSGWMAGYVTNIHLSSQRIYCEGRLLQEKVKHFGGLFIPAHVFTPFKSLYGKGVEKSLREVFNPELIDGIELGLSSDTEMARQIAELDDYVFLSNSDAHSLGKIAREYQEFRLEEANFSELEMALKEMDGRRVSVNYGLNPRLGKYHETVCAACSHKMTAPAAVCLACGSHKIIKGVSRRIAELARMEGSGKKRARPPYIHQVPLDFIPGLGPKTMERLLETFGTEMDIIHRTPKELLKQVVPEKVAEYIDLARNGELQIEVGGGGKYGRIKTHSNGDSLE
ncbi:endonuclease Q family protein [Peribacillus sp. SCS-155]|uniref:endonuclease Q family protein n=1 Tax=Peribacillus sedimenti TaxID=3115297 RepID=UPI003905A0FA